MIIDTSSLHIDSYIALDIHPKVRGFLKQTDYFVAKNRTSIAVETRVNSETLRLHLCLNGQFEFYNLAKPGTLPLELFAYEIDLFRQFEKLVKNLLEKEALKALIERRSRF